MSKAFLNASVNNARRQLLAGVSSSSFEPVVSSQAGTSAARRCLSSSAKCSRGELLALSRSSCSSSSRLNTTTHHPKALLSTSSAGSLNPGHPLSFSDGAETESSSHSQNNPVLADSDASWAVSYIEETFPSLISQSSEYGSNGRNTSPHSGIPPHLAVRMLTHISYRAGAQSSSFSHSATSDSSPSDSVTSSYSGHNARLAFMGRRVLEAYLLMFLQSSIPKSIANGPSTVAELAQTSMHLGPGAQRRKEVDLGDFEGLVESMLATHILGQRVGSVWGLGKGIRWTSAISPSVASRSPADRHSYERGKNKVFGTTVEAIIGGIFHQYGGLAAHAIFNSHVLPYLNVPEPLRGYAVEARMRLGSSTRPKFGGQDTADASPMETIEVSFSSTSRPAQRRAMA